MILILVAMFAIVPLSHDSVHISSHPQLSTYSSQTNRDPNATLTAFNYTYAQADLYTNSSKGFKANATLPSYAHLSWLQTVPRTSTGGLVPGSAFNFNLTTKPSGPGREIVSWNLTIPKFNCLGCNQTQIKFNFFGNLTKGTFASYAIYNGTTLISIANGAGNNTSTFSGQQPPVTGCPQPSVCVNATKYIGFNLTLTFRLGWNSTAIAGGMSVDVGELVVTSVDQTFKKSSSNFMLATSPTTITHQADFRSIVYNSTVSYHRAGSTSPPLLNHTWTTEILDIYYPAGYQIGQVSLNGTTFYPVSPHVAFDTERCFDAPTCSTSLFALNMSDFPPVASRNSTVVVKMTSPNSASLNTLTSGVVVSQFLPGDALTVQVVNKVSAANVTNAVNPKLNFTIIDANGSNSSMGTPQLNLPNLSGRNFTSTVPAGPYGTWKVIVSFLSNYDMGSSSKTFSVEEIQMWPSTFGYSGSNNALAAQGTMTYATSNSTTLLASNVNGVVFAVDTGVPTTNPITPPTPNPSSTSLYIANVTLVNGIFGQTQTLVMTFTIINPTSSLFSANVTFDHEWSSSQTHGVNVTIPLALGDQPFSTQISRSYSYEADISFASSPVQVKLISLAKLNARTAPMSVGSDPIVTGRQHTGLFKITLKSAILGSSTVTPFFLESSPYAYIPGLPSYSGRYLAYAAFTTRTDGSFSVTTSSNTILAAKKLVLFALARDGKGVTLVNGQNPGPTDSTILQASLDPISQLTIGQTVQPTLHLTSNASKITEIITVTETLSGSGVVDSHKVTIQPGASQPVSFTLTAPQMSGSYTVTFSSPEYGGPFAVQTVQVSVVSSNLQLLIPVAIGLVAAIIVLGFYLLRRTPEKNLEEKEEKSRPSGPKPKTQPGPGPSTSKSLTQARPLS